MQGVFNNLWLLMDLFHHEMLITAFFRSLRIISNLHNIFFDHITVQVIEGRTICSDPCHFIISDVADLSCVI